MANLAEGLGYNAVDGEDKTDPKDSAGHGTMCAGVISGFGAKGGVVGINWKNVSEGEGSSRKGCLERGCSPETTAGTAATQPRRLCRFAPHSPIRST